MLSKPALIKLPSNKELADSLAEIMLEHFTDFAEDQTSFQETMCLFSTELADNCKPSVSDMVDAIYQQIASRLIFSYFLGLKANLDHFIDPIGHTFLDVDPEIYLRENVAKQLPDYKHAQYVQEQFYAALSHTHKDKYETIVTYISHLETVGPKLAHYYGYILGNELFPHIIPGYVADAKLTFYYRRMLTEYFGISTMCAC